MSMRRSIRDYRDDRSWILDMDAAKDKAPDTGIRHISDI